MKPHELKSPPGARSARKRVGRGDGSGRGKTAGRGTKGTKARGKMKTFFEGGQMPLTRRVPKLKGFTPPSRRIYGVVNLSELAEVQGTDIGPDELRAAGLLKKRDRLVKVLGTGEIDRAITIRAHAFSTSARQKIEAAGGTPELIETSPGAAK
ncbi:MAG: 50S ribosomal protein L15 [Actinomycetota bacterium]